MQLTRPYLHPKICTLSAQLLNTHLATASELHAQVQQAHRPQRDMR